MRLPGPKFLRALSVCAAADVPSQYTGNPLGGAHFHFVPNRQQGAWR